MAIVDKLKGGKSVLERTKPGKDLPRLALYVGMAGAGRTVRSPDGTEAELTTQVLTSHYKLVTGSKAKSLIQEHWPAEKADQPSAAKPAKIDPPEKDTPATKKATKPEKKG